jgi:hypothetical protein
MDDAADADTIVQAEACNAVLRLASATCFVDCFDY